ncbi:MAG: type I restriction enzyme HsdR N-terminal domain-containing protein [Prevotellaceae bacterium]|nr:type I restriction enzyme HsdR N-terminal domain-containing protein [Prevotellaceae bacterium]
MLKLPQLNLPQYEFKIRLDNEKYVIFDFIRNKTVALTPEEWVRQNVVLHLINALNYPPNKISNETSISFNRLSKRCDTVIYDTDFKPFIIAEYKSPRIEITQKVFDQIAVYNQKLFVPYLLVSNGLTHFFCKVNFECKKYVFFENIPDYRELDVK